MGHGYILDSFSHFFRSPSTRIITSWPDDTYMLDTDVGNIRVKDTGGNKPALVMVPDGPTVIEHFEILIAELRDNFRVICFDMPGFGFSYPTLSYNFGLDKSATVITSVMDALAIERATLSFSCINGHIAISVVKLFPERVIRLVLAQTPSLDVMKNQWVNRNVPKLVKTPYIGQVVNAVMSKKFSSMWYDVALPRNSPHQESFVKKSSSALHTGGCFCFASIVQGMVNENDYVLSGLDIPITMVWGNKDWSHKGTNFESLRDNVPDCEIYEFDGCGHFPNLENPRAFAALLRKTR